jgi:HSP20 family protein
MWAEACAMLARAEGLHRQFFQPGFAGAQAATWEPPVDIFETERELWIIAALPGVESQDIAISIEGQVLSVAGLRRLPAPARGAAIHRLEIPHGRFERSIRLPAARFELDRSELASGCLVISLSKRF